MVENTYTHLGGYSWAIGLSVMSIVYALLIQTKFVWKYRRIASAINCCLIGASTGLVIVTITPFIAVWIFMLQCYRLFSLLRVVQNRVNEKRLKKKTTRTELVLGGWLAALLLIDGLLVPNISYKDMLVAVICMQVLMAVVFYRHVRTMLSSTTAILPKKFTPDSELPTVTVAIPARNETAELSDCLQSLLRNNYPKLEILVLDDCSQDRTSDIIRKFAHRGVRFIKGTPPSESWVAKNHAYDQLLDEASGEYILFCGTDVRFEMNSLRQITEIILHQHINMLSVLPQRNGVVDKHFLLQPMRYWRELAIPRLFNATPPVLSTCWVAKRSMLLKHGGFEAMRKAIRPERQIARGVAKEGHYLFLRSSSGLGVTSIKNLPSQWATAVRTRYPEHHNRPESVYFATLWHIIVLLGPLLSLVLCLANGYAVLASLCALSILYLLATHYYVYQMTAGRGSLKPFVLYINSVLLEIVVLNYSMWAYEFSEVIWKGRNVCLPVLQTNLRLPKLD